MNFSDIIGHEKIRNQLELLIKEGKFSHAHIICGEDGIGKSLIAQELAAKILEKTEIKQYADVIEWKIKSGKKSISVDQVRDIIDEVSKKPYEGDKKVIIVHDLDYMTIQGQNAFLKTIEEPPRGVFIFLLCQTAGRLLDTIKSRCQMHKLKKLSNEEMRKFIINRYPNLTEAEVKTVLAFSEGIPGRSESFIENTSLKGIRDKIIEILLNIKKTNYEDIINYSEELVNYKGYSEEIFECFVLYIRDSLVYKETGKDDLIINNDKIEDIKKMSMQFSMNRLNKISDIVGCAKSNIESNVSSELTYSMMLFKIQEV